jgi:hypothetical protein
MERHNVRDCRAELPVIRNGRILVAGAEQSSAFFVPISASLAIPENPQNCVLRQPAGGQAPLIQEGDGAFAPGGGYEIQEGSAASPRKWLHDPDSQSLIPSGRRRKR